MEFILRMKHWQLFIFLFFIPLLVMIGTIWYGSATLDLNNAFLLISFLIVYFSFTVLSWIKVVGINLNHKLPTHLINSTKRFKAAIMFTLCYSFLVAMSVVAAIYFGKDYKPGTLAFIPFVICHIFSIVCSIYSLRFVAKTLNSLEHNRNSPFSEYWEDFLLIWIFPIGVWYIQPRINKQFNKEY